MIYQVLDNFFRWDPSKNYPKTKIGSISRLFVSFSFLFRGSAPFFHSKKKRRDEEFDFIFGLNFFLSLFSFFLYSFFFFDFLFLLLSSFTQILSLLLVFPIKGQLTPANEILGFSSFSFLSLFFLFLFLPLKLFFFLPVCSFLLFPLSPLSSLFLLMMIF